MRTLKSMAMVTIAAILAMLVGCATMGVANPEEEVMATLVEYQAALKAQDMEKLMGLYSDDFTNSQGFNKDMIRNMFGSMASQGTLQSITFIGLEECKITVDGNSATVPQLIVNSPMGKKRMVSGASLAPNRSTNNKKHPFPCLLFL